ncbi:MAG: hypothetical protein GQ531_06745 [Sulfurovum sp.]|nr:hypothetical protein [Sulfurovum sp.]
MKTKLKIVSALLLSAFIFVACGAAKVYNVPKHKVAHKNSSATVYKAIKSAGQSLGWQIHQIKPGVAQGKLYLRTHLAVVRINYNSSSYSIRYVSSKNLNYNAKSQTIHTNYNGWIQNLEKAIDVRL